MPIVVLINPWMGHYAGTAMSVADITGVYYWDEDDWLIEKLNLSEKRYYTILDDGKGKSGKLPVTYTKVCPPVLLGQYDICSGPCRVTSISESLNCNPDPYYASDLPKGRGLISLEDSPKYEKNMMSFTSVKFDNPSMITLRMKYSGEILNSAIDILSGSKIDFTNYSAGPYNVEIMERSSVLHSFTVFKSFPFVAQYNFKTQKFTFSKTIW